MVMSNGLEIGQRALIANRYAMDVIGHNVANINTEGYSRQQIKMSTTNPVSIPVENAKSPVASVGTGVKVEEIIRVRNQFLDSQRRDIQANLGQWETTSSNYTMIEGIYNEPSDDGISAQLDQFWNSWQGLANPDPSSPGARKIVVSQATRLASNVRDVRSQLNAMQENANDDIQLKIEEINSYGEKIASLNQRIVEVSATSNANDLEDRRDRLVGELAKLVNIDYFKDEYSNATVAVGGVFLTAGDQVNKLATRVNQEKDGLYDVIWESNSELAAITGGELKGIIDSRDSVISANIDKVDTFTKTLIDKVNEAHRQGFDLNGNAGVNFFTGINGSDIQVNTEISYDPSRIAAADYNQSVEGNGQNALNISGARYDSVLSSDTLTINEFFQNVISDLGVDASEAHSYMETNTVLLTQIDGQISSYSGVSLDEEMSNLIKYQHAFGAAAKYIGTINQTLEVLMNLVR